MKENNVRPEDLPKQIYCGLFERMSYTYDLAQKSLLWQQTVEFAMSKVGLTC